MAAKPRLTEEAPCIKSLVESPLSECEALQVVFQAARQLLVSAESSLDGLTPECLRAATDALNIFRGLGAQIGAGCAGPVAILA